MLRIVLPDMKRGQTVTPPNTAYPAADGPAAAISRSKEVPGRERMLSLQHRYRSEAGICSRCHFLNLSASRYTSLLSPAGLRET